MVWGSLSRHRRELVVDMVMVATAGQEILRSILMAPTNPDKHLYVRLWPNRSSLRSPANQTKQEIVLSRFRSDSQAWAGVRFFVFFEGTAFLREFLYGEGATRRDLFSFGPQSEGWMPFLGGFSPRQSLIPRPPHDARLLLLGRYSCRARINCRIFTRVSPSR